MKLSSTKYAVAILGLLVILGGISVFIGWQFDITFLKCLVEGLKPMTPSTALLFIIAGIWVLRRIYNLNKQDFKNQSIAFFIIAFTAYHLVLLYFHNTTYRIDYLSLLYFESNFSKINNELTSISALITFLFVGIIMSIFNNSNNFISSVRHMLLVLLLLTSYVSILGYLFGIRQEFRMGGFAPMALNTSIAFLVLSVALILSSYQFTLTKLFTSDLEGGKLLRIGLPFVFFVPPTVGYFRLLGEKMGYYPSEFGVEINTLTIIISTVSMLIWYATHENKKQLQRMKTDLRLSASESRYKGIVQSIKEGVISVNLEGRILYCNGSLCNITGYTEQELIGRNSVELLVPNYLRNEAYDIILASTNVGPQNFEIELKKKNDEKIWVNVKTSRLINHQGEQYGILATIDDITEDLMKIQDLKAFNVSAAHDLNSPLSRIITISDLLSMSELDEEQMELIKVLQFTANDMKNLLKDLLEFSKLGTNSLDKQLISIDKIVKEVCLEQKPKNYHGTLKIHPVPENNANEASLKRLFTNLISNAIKYTMDLEHPFIEIGSYVEDEQVVYYVKDNGNGLDEESIKNLFTPFKRFHSGIEGNGMGLAIVKRIVEKHGGNIWAKSTPSTGMAFFFTLN